MVRYGIDNLAGHAADKLLKSGRVGLITAPTGLDTHFRSTVDILHERYRLTALFAPEHGVRGDLDAGELLGDSVDTRTGVPVYSLYRKDSKRFTPEMLASFDVLVYDIQDVGCRFFTFITTLLYAMEDCARAGKPVVVLDRPNPLGGDVVEGNILQQEYMSFIGPFAMCMRYGLTVGEYALMVNDRLGLGAALTVVPCTGLARDMQWPDAGLHWVYPSPGLARFDSALLYAGTCLFEGTNLSEGRGGPLPFEMVGAPYIDDAEGLAGEMNARALPGVLFRPLYFTPYTSKNQGKLCAGVQLHITDRRSIRPVHTALELLYTIKEWYSDSFNWCTPLPPATRPHIELLDGDGSLMRNVPLGALLARYAEDEARFAAMKQAYHIY